MAPDKSSTVQDAMPTAPLSIRAGRGVLWGQFGSGLQIGLSVIVSLGMIRYLGPSIYGAYSLVMGVASILVTVTSLGVGPTFGRFLPRLHRQSHQTRPSALVLDALMVRSVATTAVSLILALISKQLAPAWNISWSPIWPAFLALIIVFQGVADVLRRALIAMLALKSVALADTLAQLVALMSLALAWLLLPPALSTGLFISTVMLAVGCASLLWASKGILAWQGSRTDYPEIARFSAIAWGIALVTFGLENQIDLVLIGVLVRDTVQVGYYAVAASLIVRLATFALAWTATSLPTLTEAHMGGMARLNIAWQNYMRLLIILLVPAFLFVAAYSQSLVIMLAGEEYGAAAPILSVLAIYYVFAGLFGIGLATNYLLVVGEQRRDLGLRVVGATGNIILDVLFIQRFGVIGAAIATAAANIVILASELIIVLVRYRARFPLLHAAKVILASVSALALSWLAARVTNLLVGGMVYTLVLLGLFRLVQPWEKDDIDMLGRINPATRRIIERVFLNPLFPQNGQK